MAESEADDVIDASVAARFALLDGVAPPDVWQRVDQPEARRVGRRWRWAVSVAVVAALGGVLAVSQVAGQGGPQVTTGEPSHRPAAPSSALTAPGQTSAGLAVGEPCGLGDAGGVVGGDIGALRAGAAAVVTGQVVSVERGPDPVGGTVLLVKHLGTEATNRETFDVRSIWVSGAVPGDGTDFVGFLSGERVPHPGRPGPEEPWAVLPGGLYLGCGRGGPAFQAGATPDGVVDLKRSGMTVDQLWQSVRFPVGGSRETQLLPVRVENGDAVFDVGLADGGRYRLVLPQEVAAGELTMTEHPGGRTVALRSEGTAITIAFARCSDWSELRPNSLGAFVAVRDGGLRWCRDSNALAMTVDTERLPVGAADRIDLRAVVLGSTAEAAARDMHVGTTCPECVPWGPLTFYEQQVSVAVVGQRVTAIRMGDLRDAWSFDVGVERPSLHQGPGVVYVDAPGAMLTQLEPTTGSLRWQLRHNPENARPR